MMREGVWLIYNWGINDLKDCRGGSNEYFYRKWVDMIRRCHDPNYIMRNKNYCKVTICKEWKYFSNFKAWMETQDWQGKQLDKDLLGAGTLYSPETCCFIYKSTNVFIVEGESSENNLMIGVTRHRDKFQATCSPSGTNLPDYIGLFQTEEEAHLAWLSRKIELSKIHAEKYTDKRISKALIDRYENYSYRKKED